MNADREVLGEAAANPLAAADAEQHAMQKIASLQAHLARWARWIARGLAAAAGALAGWLILIRRERFRR
jgi:hypothetical protein